MRHDYDALLLLSFGGPERPEDILPFLENVTRGRGVPPERLLSVAEHYHHLGGKSPLNEQNRALIAALEQDFAAHGIELPIFFGNRNWAPLLGDTLAQIQAAGHRRVLTFITSAYSSYSGCRQYLEDIERARAALSDAPNVDVLRRFFNHPAFLDASFARLHASWEALRAELGDEALGRARIAFTAHSIPLSMARSCDYQRQLLSNSQLLAERLGHPHWDLVWQSRSGPPEVPWLAPDILDHIRELHGSHISGLVIAPIGFLSDHVEVLYDLDEEARQLCQELGLPMQRAATVGTHPRFVEMIRSLVLERMAGEAPLGVGPLPAPPNVCAPGCCPRPERPPARRP